jgi:tetratricopeptide (TPR) repeat protein
MILLPFSGCGTNGAAAAERPPESGAVSGTAEKPAEETLPAFEATDTQSVLTRIAVLLGKPDYEGALALFDVLDSDEAEKTEIQLLKASVLSSAGKTADAADIVNRILGVEGENPEALLVLAAINGAGGKEKERRAALERIIKVKPDHIEALLGLGNIALGARSLRQAMSYFDKVLAAEAGNKDALVGKALVYRYDRRPKDAERFLNRAVKENPQWARARSERARLYNAEGYPNYALEDLNIAKELDPDDYYIAVDMGSVLLNLNRREDALKEFTRAIAINPRNFLAYVYSAGIKDDLKDYEGAEADYTILAKLRPDYYFAFEGLGILKMRKRLYTEARDNFLEVCKHAPKEPGYALLAAMNWMRGDNITGPKVFLEQALRRVDRESLDWYMLRLYHDLSGDNDVAIRIDQEKDHDKKARMLYYLANYYDIRGNTRLADKYFLQMKELDRRTMLEWRLNEIAVEERNLQIF